MKLKTRILAMLLTALMIVGILPISLFALDEAAVNEKTDASASIKTELADYFHGETKSYDDGYIGIPVEVTVLYDDSINIKSGYDVDATPVVIYVINTMVERIGTDSDITIIQSMIDRGFIVVLFDYLNSEKAVSPALDWSVQGMRAKITNGAYLSETAGIATGNYYNNMVVPAGYNIDFNLVFWEIDKHGADGTFDKIVEIWNNDFRGVNGEILIKWVDGDGNRKATQNGFDESTPVWCNADGAASESGQYIKVKHTKAEKIEDCVKKDGTPIDLNLYMHVTYPTNPGKDVPVMVLSNSSEHLAAGTQTADRPHFNGFMFNGYATAVFDHGYTPMARNDHYKYFDGNHPEVGSVTGDNTTYSIHFYNEIKINTAAMRYLRYLSASDHDTYSFKDTAIGVYGNSKGGWATMLGEEHPEAFAERRIVPGYSGESRYEAGKTETAGFIDGGMPQPWLTYGGKTLDSGADFVYMGCGGGVEQITENHAPMFISCPTRDSSYYSTVNQFVNACRNLDVPAIWFEINMGHTIASGPDLRYGVDTYNALFTFANYYLKDDAVKVIYSDRNAEYSGMPTNAPITVKFSGPVSESEIAKVLLKDKNGNTVIGKWTSQFGNTEWTLNPPTLSGNAEYTLTVPQGIKGDNRKGMTEEHTLTFVTGYETSSSVSSVQTSNGTYFYFTVPTDKTVFDKELNVYKLRLNVSNDAANKLEVYSLTGFNASSPDSSTVGSKITTLPVTGAGYYDVDLSTYVSELNAGTAAAFLVKQASTAGEKLNNSNALESTLGTVSVYNGVVYSFAETPDGVNALKIESVNADTTYTNDSFIKNPGNILQNSNIIKNGNLTADDLGRTFKISFRVFDTESRIITVKMNHLTSINLKFADYESYYFNYYTKANEWVDVEFTYTVYEPKYEDVRGSIMQSVHIIAPTRGTASAPFYVSDMKSTEIITDVTFDGAELLLGTTEQRQDPLITPYGTIPEIYEDADEYPVILFDRNGKVLNVGTEIVNSNGTSGVLSYTQNANATSDFPNNDVIVYVRKDITQSASYGNFSFQFGNILIDLADNTLTCIGRLFQCQAKRGGVLNVTVKNGTVLQKSNSLIYYASVDYPHATVGIREFNFNFENVTLGYTEGASATSFVNGAGTSVAPVKGEITFTNCEFDLITNAPSGTYTLFKANTDSNANISLNIHVEGGLIKANSMTGVTVGTTSGSNVFEFTKNANGSYTAIELPSSATAPTGSYLADGKGVCFTASTTADGITKYILSEDPLWTPYGYIPSDYASKENYPFVSFTDNGDGTFTFQNAEKDVFNNSSQLMIAARNVKTVIYMRHDYTATTSFSNYGFCKDNTFDLGGKTLSFTLHNQPQSKGAFDKHITFKNGTIQAPSTYSLFRFNSIASGAGVTFYFTFDNIIFDLPDDTKYAAPILYFPGSSDAHGVDVTFNNCTFDISGTIPNGMALFTAGDSSGNCVANVKVNGGKIIADTLTGLKLISPKTGSTITFDKFNGEYTKIECTVPASYANESVPSFKVTSSEGAKIYAVTTISGGKEIYTLITAPNLSTKYGTIPYKYASDEVYPFVLFKDNGDGTYTCMGAESDIFPNTSVIMQKARNINSVILMRRDFTKTIATAHGNLCYINGALAIDLNGNTLTIHGGTAFLADAKKVVTTNSIVFKNGTVSLDGKNFIEFNSSLAPTTEGTHVFDITFDGIKFVLTGNASILKYVDNMREFTVNVKYNNCIIDMTSAAVKSSVFASGSTGGKITGAVTVIGGEIKGLKATQNVVNEQNPSSTVRFGQGLSGYTLFTGALIQEIYIGTDGRKLTLVESNTSGVYVLSRYGKDGITSLYGNNLLLGSDVVVNFYIDIDTAKVDGAYVEIGRVSDYDKGVTVKIPLSELETENIDGNTYYVVSFGVPAKDMGMLIIARLVKDGDVISTEYSYSAQTYIDTVIAKELGGDITPELKALVKALDVYGKNAAAVLVEGAPEVDTITGVDFSGVTEPSGSISEGKKIRLDSISLELKSNIKIRIYVIVTTEDFTATINGKSVNAIKVSNKVWCIEQAVIAAELYDTYTFVLESGESYLTLNISALYYAKIMNDKADTETEKNLMKAIKLYADAAIKYQLAN